MTQLYNRRRDTAKRQMLRGDAPEAEKRLWQELREKQRRGWKFRRQYGVGCYVLDFYCPAFKLAIEIDGPTHDGGDTPEYDAARQAYIETTGIQFLRFSNADVFQYLSDVVTAIDRWIAAHEEKSPFPAETDAESQSPPPDLAAGIFAPPPGLPLIKGEE